MIASPDLPALDNGAPAGYLTYPANPQQEYANPPAKGGTISSLMTGNVPAPPLSKNPFWQALNKRLGATLDQNVVVAGDDFNAKLSTTIASGSLPDLIQMPLSWPNLPDVLKAEFQDLTPWLGGESIQRFRGLASLPTYGWQAVSLNRGLWGIPWAFSSQAGSANRVRQDILDGVGFDGEMASGPDFLALCKELTDVKKSRWAICDLNTTALTMALEMAGAPNGWKEVDGKFTSAYEAGEYKDGLGVASQLWKLGYVYPDAATTLAQGQVQFLAGKGAILRQAYTNWAGLAQRGKTVTGYRQGSMALPKWDGGGQCGHWLSSGVYTFTAMKKASDARVEELLTVLDWFATPFGSEEYLFTRYGIPERDYTLEGTDPVETPTGANECQNMTLTYYATDPIPLYTPGASDSTKAQYDGLSKLMKVTVPSPIVGLFSATQLTTGATIGKTISDLELDIISGRKPLSAWDAGVKAWKSGGGDKIATEYEASYAANK